MKKAEITGPSITWTTFLSVFNMAYWYILLVFVAVFIASLILVSYYSEEENNTFKTKFLNVCSAVSSSLKAFVAFDFPKVSYRSPRKYSSKRVHLFAISFLGAANFNGYNAGLILSLDGGQVSAPNQ